MEQHISQLYSITNRPQTKKAQRSERAELIEYFFTRLEIPYTAYIHKQLTRKRTALKVAHLTRDDLYYLKSICDRSDNFSKTFWGSLKIKK